MDGIKRQEVFHYIQLQKHEKAQELIESYLSESPNDGEAIYLISICLNDSGNFEEALDCAMDCVRMEGSNFFFSNSAAVNSLLGVIYLNLGEYRKSEEHYLEALREQPNNAVYMGKYAYLMMAASQPKKAYALLAEAKRIDPLSKSIKSIENEIIFMDSKEKNRAFVTDLRNGDISVDELILLGNECIDKQNYEEAKEYFRQAFLMKPENLELCEVLNNLEKETSLWMLPMRVIGKIGSVKLWLVFILLIFILRSLGRGKLFIAVSLTYFIIVVYSYTASKLYDMFTKIKNKFL